MVRLPEKIQHSTDPGRPVLFGQNWFIRAVAFIITSLGGYNNGHSPLNRNLAINAPPAVLGTCFELYALYLLSLITRSVLPGLKFAREGELTAASASLNETL